MSKRFFIIMLVVLICLSLFPISIAAIENVTANYANGVVTIQGTGYTGGTGYTVRVVDTVNSMVKAMGQTTANRNGEISISITTGVLETISNYTVYINKPDGTLAGSKTSISSDVIVGGVTTPPTDSTNGDNAITNSSDVKDANVAATDTNTTAAKDTTILKVEKSAFNDLINKAKEAEASGREAVVEIKVETAAGAKAAEVEIPRDSFNKMSEATSADIKVDTGIGTITFNAKAVKSIYSEADTGNISISIARIDAPALTAVARQKIGDRPVYNFTVKVGSTEVSKFNGGQVSIGIPYTPKSGEKGNSIIVYYVDGSGMLNPVNCRYDNLTGIINFKTYHFSQYAVGYNEVSFNDVAANAWYNEAVGFMAARGIVKGIGGGRFAPGNNVTRADLLIMVMNSYGIELDSAITDNFVDAGNKYYTKYLATAKRLGIIYGTGGNKYSPEATISRQDMFTILYRVLKKLDELPTGIKGNSLGNFNDAGDIAVYAKDVLKLFVETGTISGDGKKLYPKRNSTRAEAAQVLYNLLSK